MSTYSNSRDFDEAKRRRMEAIGLDIHGNRFGEGTSELAASDRKKELEYARSQAKRWAESIDEDEIDTVDLSDLEANWLLLIGRPATEADGSTWERISTLQDVKVFDLRNTPAPVGWSPKKR